jgi:hypothetical protein
MDSMSLTPGQIAKIRGQVMRQLDYLTRLTDRIERQRFPQADPLRVNAIRARRAMEQLLNAVPIKPLRNAT